MIIGIPERYSKLMIIYLYFSKIVDIKDDDVKKRVNILNTLISDDIFKKNYKRYFKFSEKDDFYDIVFSILLKDNDIIISNIDNIIRTKFYSNKDYINKLDDLNNSIMKISNNLSILDKSDLKIRFIEIVDKIYNIYKIKILSDLITNLSDEIKSISDIDDDKLLNFEKVLSYINNNNIIDISSDDIVGFDVSNIDRINKIVSDIRYCNILREIDFIETNRVAVFLGATGGGKSMVLTSIFGDYLTNKIYSDKYLLFYFTFENSVEETMLRILARITQEDINKIKSNINDNEYKKMILETYKSEINNSIIPIVIYLPPNIHTTQSIDEKISYYLSKFNNYKVLSIIVDYILLIKSMNYNIDRDRRVDIGNVVIDLKNLAKKYNTSVITASQLNRAGVESIKKSKLVDETNIAESFLIVNNADIVVAFQTQDTNIRNIKTITFYILKHRYSSSSGIFVYNADFSKATIYPSSHKINVSNNNTINNNVNMKKIVDKNEFDEFSDFVDDDKYLL